MKKIHFLKHFICFSLLFLLVSGMNSCYYDNEDELYNFVNEEQCDTTNITYSQTIAPIMSNNCNSCHSSVATYGNIATDNYNDLVTNIEAIWGSANHFAGYSAMPKGGSKISDCNILKIQGWMQNGKPNN
jgi:hypothetical protein